MKKVPPILLMLFFCVSIFGQTKTGTLKIFSEIPQITIFLDENKQVENTQQVNDVPVGSHYLKILSGTLVVYSEVVEIKDGSVTTILIKNSGQDKKDVGVQEQATEKAVEKKVQNPVANSKTGTLKIFSELAGVNIYLDENKQGTDIQQVNDIPAGSHYLKALLGNTSVFGEVVEIKEGGVTTVLIKNTGQVQEKLLESKTAEQDTYANSRLDVLLSRGMSTTTKGYSNLFPGYYGYWGTSTSSSNSVETTDWKIIQGGVKEISEYNFASITGNTALQNSISAQLKKEQKITSTGAIIFLVALIPTGIVVADFISKNHFLHKDTPTHPDWEVGVAAGGIVVCTISYAITMKKPYSGHYTTPDRAAQDAREFNRNLKSKLGLPDSYEVK